MTYSVPAGPRKNVANYFLPRISQALSRHLRSHLLVVPKSTLQDWSCEFEKWISDFKVILLAARMPRSLPTVLLSQGMRNDVRDVSYRGNLSLPRHKESAAVTDKLGVEA